MSSLEEALELFLADFESRREPFYEVSIVDGIRRLLTSHGETDSEPPIRALAESMAFGFRGQHDDDERCWGTYFGPLAVFQNADGRVIETPSIRSVTPEMLDYWAQRADDVKHPRMRARYADLVWDFSKTIRGKNAEVRYAQLVIDSTIEAAKGNYYEYPSEVHEKLGRSLSIALSINDHQRIERVRDAVVVYERDARGDRSDSPWAFPFRALIENKKVPMTVVLEREIIQGLEAELARRSGAEGEKHIDPNAAEVIAMLLRKYYRGSSRTGDVHRVLRQYGQACRHWAKAARPFLGKIWLKKAYEAFCEAGMKDDAREVAVLLQEANAESTDDMSTMSHEFTIPRSEIEAYLAQITSGSLPDALDKVAAQFIPNLEEARETLRRIAEKSPILMHVTRQLQDDAGRTVAEVGPFESDAAGHLVLQLWQNMQFMDVILRMAMKEVVSKYNVHENALCEYVFASPLFGAVDRPLVRIGLEAYLSEKFAIAVHMLVPRIEAALRNLVGLMGGSIYRPDLKRGGTRLRTLDDLLRDERIVKLLGEDITRYLQVFLTDQRGANVRNDVCHGICDANSFRPAIADRVFHIILLLSLVRFSDTKAQPAA